MDAGFVQRWGTGAAARADPRARPTPEGGRPEEGLRAPICAVEPRSGGVAAAARSVPERSQRAWAAVAGPAQG